jgi:ParB family protein of integrating conjugative element (PFGI_1 class)
MTPRTKRPNQDQLKDLLLEGHFTSDADTADLAAADSVMPVQLVLTLAQIKTYDHNPRRERNPAYDDIKASIREQRGLNNPFTVTLRPGEDRYMIQSGGNTRLAILNELYAETGDEAFNTVQCLYVPWQSEAAVLSAHLIENELRGEMTLIDKAYAIRELQHQLESEYQQSFSRSELCKRIKALGYSLSRRHLIRFEYALELDQFIPNTLRNGLGANRIDTIKNTEKAYQRVCRDKTEQFAALFAHTLSSFDDERWDFDAVRRELDKQLAPLLNIGVNRLRLEIDALLFNQSVIDDDWPDDSGGITKEPSAESSPHGQHPSQSAHDIPTSNDKQLQQPGKPQHAEPNCANISDKSGNIQILYDRTYGLAKRIAESMQLEASVLPVNQGLGFIIETPAAAFTAHQTWGIWWLLLGISEQIASPERVPLWQQTDLYRLYQAEDAAELHQLVGPAPSLSHYPHEVLQNAAIIKDPVFADICQLIETCRLIRQQFSNTQLWPIGPA